MISSHDKLSSFQSRPKRPREEYDSAADWEDTKRKRKGPWGYLKKEEFFKWAIASYSKRRETKRYKIEMAIFSFFENIKVFLILFEVVGIFVILGISFYGIAGNKKWEDISPFWQWYTYIIMGGLFAFPWLHLLNTFLSSRFGASLWDILVSPFESLCYRILDRFFPPVIEKPSLDTMVHSCMGFSFEYFLFWKVFRFLAFFPTITDFLPKVRISEVPLEEKEELICDFFCQENGLPEKERERLREILSSHTPHYILSENFEMVFFLKEPKALDILSAAARAFYKVPRFLWEGPWGPERLLFLILAFGRDFPSLQESENDPGFYFQVCERDLENWVFLMKKIWTERGRGIEYLDQAIQKVLKKYEITEIKTLADFCVAMGCVAKPEWEREGLPVPSGLSSDGLDVTRVLSCCLDGLKNEDTLWTEVYLSLQRVLSEAKGNDSEESYHTDQTTQ